ncbi:MAG: hypothetical protein AB8G14_06775 [Ilumatobacter sp.]
MGTDRTIAEKLVRVNIVLGTICFLLLIVSVVRQLWFPAAVFAVLVFSNGFQYVTRKRTVDHPPSE